LPEPEHTTNVTLGELMSGPVPPDDPTDGGLLEDDLYLLEPPRRLSRLTIVLVVTLIFLCGFIVGVLAARLTSGHARSSAESSLVSTVGLAPAVS
jgi:hypothetical protein